MGKKNVCLKKNVYFEMWRGSGPVEVLYGLDYPGVFVRADMGLAYSEVRKSLYSSFCLVVDSDSCLVSLHLEVRLRFNVMDESTKSRKYFTHCHAPVQVNGVYTKCSLINSKMTAGRDWNYALMWKRDLTVGAGGSAQYFSFGINWVCL